MIVNISNNHVHVSFAVLLFLIFQIYDVLEKAQNSSLRIIVGKYASTPPEALWLETGIESCETTSKRLTAQWESHAFVGNTPSYEVLNNNAAPHRSIKKSSWRQESEKINRSFPWADLEREPLLERVQRPWTSSQSFDQWSTRWELKEQIKHSQTPVTIFSFHNNQIPWNIDPPGDTEESGRNVVTEAAIQTMASYEKDTIIYIDGSCKDGTEYGGDAAVVTTGSARYPIELEVLQKKRQSIHIQFWWGESWYEPCIGWDAGQ